MKKIISLVLAVLMLTVLFAACKTTGSEGTPTDTSSDTTVSSEAEPTPTPEQTEEPTPSPAEKPDVTPVAVYSFDAVDGTAVADESGNGYNGTLIGSPVVAEGKFGKALTLDGTNGVSIPVDAGKVGKLFTVAAWINIPADAPERPMRVLSTGVWGPNTTGFQLGIDTSYGKGCFVYCVGVQSGDPCWLRQTEFANRIRDGKWHHIAIAFDLDTYLAIGYLDGEIMDLMTIPEASDASPWSALTALSIGGAYVDGEMGEGFVGTVDELCIVDNFLDANGVQYLIDNTLFDKE